MILDSLRSGTGVLDYVAEGFWHTDPENIVSWIKSNYRDFTDEEKGHVFGRIYSGLGNLFHRFELDEEGQVKYFCRCGHAIDRQYNVKYARRYLSLEEQVDSMQKNESKLTNYEVMRVADLEFNLRALKENEEQEEKKDKQGKEKKPAKASKQLRKLRSVGGVVEYIANELLYSNPENVANWLKENYEQLTLEEKRDIVGTVFTGANASYHKFEVDANNELKYTCKEGAAIDKEFLDKHLDENIDASQQIHAMQQNADDLTDFEKARLSDLQVKQCSFVSVEEGNVEVLQSAQVSQTSQAVVLESVQEARPAGAAFDYVAEGLWHTNPENIASWVGAHAKEFSEEEKAQIFGKVFSGLGGMYHKYELDENGEFSYTCRTKNEIDREYRANHEGKYTSLDQQLSSMEENKEALSDFESARMHDLPSDIKFEELIADTKSAPDGRNF